MTREERSQERLYGLTDKLLEVSSAIKKLQRERVRLTTKVHLQSQKHRAKYGPPKILRPV